MLRANATAWLAALLPLQPGPTVTRPGPTAVRVCPHGGSGLTAMQVCPLCKVAPALLQRNLGDVQAT